MRTPLVPVMLLIGALASPVAASTTTDGEESIGIIVYATGGTVSMLRDGRTLEHDADAAIGEPVYEGDQIATGSETFVELQLLVGTTMVKIAENTTFSVERLRNDRVAIEATYGRFRARVERLAGASFEIAGMTVVAGVRGTNLAYDQIIDSTSGALVNRVACFDGEVLVSARTDRSVAITLSAGEGLSVPVGGGIDDVRRELVVEPLRDYWELWGFVTEPRSVDGLQTAFPQIVERSRAQLGFTPSVLTAGSASDEDDADTPSPAAGDAEAASVDVAAGPGGEGGGDGGEATVADGTAPRVVERERADRTPDAGEEEAGAQADGERLARVLRTSGFVVAGAGLLADLAAIGLYYFGDELIPGWGESGSRIVRPLAIGGLGGLAVGLTAIVISYAVGR